jgi:hypothetical protein
MMDDIEGAVPTRQRPGRCRAPCPFRSWRVSLSVQRAAKTHWLRATRSSLETLVRNGWIASAVAILCEVGWLRPPLPCRHNARRRCHRGRLRLKQGSSGSVAMNLWQSQFPWFDASWPLGEWQPVRQLQREAHSGNGRMAECDVDRSARRATTAAYPSPPPPAPASTS